MKPNAVRLLERPGIPFELHSYRVDDDYLSAEEVATALKMPPEMVFKTPPVITIRFTVKLGYDLVIRSTFAMKPTSAS